MKDEPLKPEPDWKETGAGFFRPTGGTPHSIPEAYATGFEEGAFALAEKLNSLLAEKNLPGLVSLLGQYKNGNARPAKGWKHESPRR